MESLKAGLGNSNTLRVSWSMVGVRRIGISSPPYSKSQERDCHHRKSAYQSRHDLTGCLVLGEAQRLEPFVFNESSAVRWLLGSLIDHGSRKGLRNGPAVNLVWHNAKLFLREPNWIVLGAYVDCWLIQSWIEVLENFQS
jgi:hypothetical protein